MIHGRLSGPADAMGLPLHLVEQTSGATSPGAPDSSLQRHGGDHSRYRPRTFDYNGCLPYATEDRAQQLRNLDEILKNLFICIRSEDWTPGAVLWTRELKAWLALKFDLPTARRVQLVKLFYMLSLAPGLESGVVERFAGIFMSLTKRKHYLKPIADVKLDWRPLLREIKDYVVQDDSITRAPGGRTSIKILLKIAAFAQLYFDPDNIPAMFDEILPYFSLSVAENAYASVGLLLHVLPTSPSSSSRTFSHAKEYLPTLFHLWQLGGRSRIFDVDFIDIISRVARDALPNKDTPFGAYGMHTSEQASHIFTCILRLLEIPVGPVPSVYSSADHSAGMAMLLERDSRKHPIGHQIARWIVMSLSPHCLSDSNSIMSNLERLIQAVETFFHPSNSGSWTRPLAQMVYYLTDFFVMRWNRERSGELVVPDDRRLNDEIKHRFVKALIDVTFLGIYSKSSTAMTFSLSTLSSLAYLEPDLVLPGVLQRVYPSLQGLVEVHRTTSSLRSLQVLTGILVRTKGYRCHFTSLLGFALPGVDANDLDKTMYTLQFIQAASYNIPFHDLTAQREDINGSEVAMEWITQEIARFEVEGPDLKCNYADTLSDEEEARILRSSTAGFQQFVVSFIDRTFVLLENLPDAAKIKSGSAEENVANTLPATYTPLLASLSPDLLDLATDKIIGFIDSHVIHQARDAMAFICNAMCKVKPEKALKKLLPKLLSNIRAEISQNGAGMTRNVGTEILPRDRGLVWNISMLSMAVIHVGDAVMPYKYELLDIASFMQQNCKGISSTHVSNFIHHLLLNLTSTYTSDYGLFDRSVYERGVDQQDWGRRTSPADLAIEWHSPSAEGVEFAITLFERQANYASEVLQGLIAKRIESGQTGVGKEWSDEVTDHLNLLRLIVSGISVLFDPQAVAAGRPADEDRSDDEDAQVHNGFVLVRSPSTKARAEGQCEEESDEDTCESHEEEDRQLFSYHTGYPLKAAHNLSYQKIQDLHNSIGTVLHEVHSYLTGRQEDDVPCLTALYLAYRTWFTDVGFERSAHTLDRVTRLLTADVHPYKISGLRKEYPRPLLLRRANIHHLQRLRHSSLYRPKSAHEDQLLKDLAQSGVSTYLEVRRSAQYAIESGAKILFGAKPVLIEPLITSLEEGIKSLDFSKIKGALHSLLKANLRKRISTDWRFAKRLIPLFVAASQVDRPSVVKLCDLFSPIIADMGRPGYRMTIIDTAIVSELVTSIDDRLETKISTKAAWNARKRLRHENGKAELVNELVPVAKASHWKKKRLLSALLLNMGLRFEIVASDEIVDMLVEGNLDEHPAIRGIYTHSLLGLFALLEIRAAFGHDYRRYLADDADISGQLKLKPRTENPRWTDEFLAAFKGEKTDHYILCDFPGWLVWGKEYGAREAVPKHGLLWDERETAIRKRIGKIMNRNWFKQVFGYLKQEPRDKHGDHFRVSNAMLLLSAFELVYEGIATATFSDIKEEVATIYGDGTDKHQHRATAEIWAGMLLGSRTWLVEARKEAWDYVTPLVLGIFENGLTPENSSYWLHWLSSVCSSADPRKAYPLTDWISQIRLDIHSNAAFKESAKLNFMTDLMSSYGWHFQRADPIFENLVRHLDHPYKGVREAMGQALGVITNARYHESYTSVEVLMRAQLDAGPLGVTPFKTSAALKDSMTEAFGRLEKWRGEREPGQTTPSSYTSGSKTMLMWLETMMGSHECAQLAPFLADTFLEPLLYMMDIKEDTELTSLAYHVFRNLASIPLPPEFQDPFLAKLMDIARTNKLWHQRLRVLIILQVLYYRRLFQMSGEKQQEVRDCLCEMLRDSQTEVRQGAAITLSGIIRCSPAATRKAVLTSLTKRFSTDLRRNPLPRKLDSGTSTPVITPAAAKTIEIRRHAAVLGLGALIQAFPYQSPPPSWMPEILATLAVKASGDPGMVGREVKKILGDFKKTRQDTWHVDVKAFTAEEVEDLEGVLWKNYMA